MRFKGVRSSLEVSQSVKTVDESTKIHCQTTRIPSTLKSRVWRIGKYMGLNE